MYMHICVYKHIHIYLQQRLVKKETINLKESGKWYMEDLGVRKNIIKIKYQKYFHRNNEN